MTRVLHLVARPDPVAPSATARDLGASASTGARVLELFDPRPGAPVVDLSLAERDVAEIASVLHATDEIHLHGVHPRVALRCLPGVRDALLDGIALVVHGEVPLPREDGRTLAWPGPVRCDPTAAAVLGVPALAPAAFVIDPHAPELLPRACGPIPLATDDGGRLAVVSLGAGLEASACAYLRLELPALSRPEVRIEVHLEQDAPLSERAALRRAAQAVLLGPQDPRALDRAFLEALLQGLPIAVLGDRFDDPPPDVVFLGASRDSARAITIVRAWTSAWARGDAPAVDVAARRAYVLARRLAA
ncbi:MAG: hypothetical protein K1X88_31005 [Nannocystaceae bacterium]|nr:hypothetical protein [Nannocystaceae bacterium]